MIQNKLIVKQCRLFDKEIVDIQIENGCIKRIGEKLPDSGVELLDARENLVTPGLIDVHIQGAGGADVLDGTREALEKISRTCARHGTTGFLATTVHEPGGKNRHLDLTRECMGTDLGGAHLLGVHLEGPFISSEKKGMIQLRDICVPSLELFEKILDQTQGSLKMMTIAPELENSLSVIRELVQNKIVAAFAHSDANYAQTLAGFEAGISHVTHLYNAMRPLHHREPGPLLAIFNNKTVTAQVIPDGVHSHPDLVRFTYELLGKERFIPITDGMQAIGLPDGLYTYNGIQYESKNGTARYHDGTLIGTSLGLDQLIVRMTRSTGCSFEDAVYCGTAGPARVLGLENRKGFIREGFDADLVVWDQNHAPLATIVAGRVVYQSQTKKD